jgi:hypothetical protein
MISCGDGYDSDWLCAHCWTVLCCPLLAGSCRIQFSPRHDVYLTHWFRQSERSRVRRPLSKRTVSLFFNEALPQLWCKLRGGGRGKTRARSSSNPARVSGQISTKTIELIDRIAVLNNRKISFFPLRNAKCHMHMRPRSGSKKRTAVCARLDPGRSAC